MKKTSTAQITETRLAEYKPPVYLVDDVELDFNIGPKSTIVKSCLSVRRNPESKEKRAPLVLLGEGQKLLSVRVNGVELGDESYELTDKALTFAFVPDEAFVEIESSNEPAKNTALSGLYAAGSMLCTQCESEGFRRITFFPDRPDVQSKYRVTIHADQKKYPVLLANGNLIKKGKEKNGRHYAVWEDPFRKPCYLFALVAGKLEKATSHFITKSKRKVLIEIYVEPGRVKETGFAMEAIKKAMRWDEQRFGREYDLDRFMIVAVSAFNFGAMENKGLNIFNDTCVLGSAETATDSDIAFFERVVGHEYFHNWTGDRVTCRDWFQLSLKEGLTVFREQEFCGDMNGRGAERIDAVSKLRRFQFSEDAGAMAHPIRPASYQAIDNFYTMTVYEKGAEVIRMLQTLLGPKRFRKGMDLYFKRHDGQSATCDQFVTAMADANAIDLTHFMLWYSQAGTPVLDVTSKYDAKKLEYTLRVKQSTPPTPGQPKKKPLYMPFSIGLLDKAGNDMKGTFVIDLMAKDETFVFLNVESKPVPSLLRDFSAPVRLNYNYTDEELLLLMAHDSDGFNRWEAAQKLLMKYALSGEKLPVALISALRSVLLDKKLDAATKAMTLIVPTEGEMGLALVAKGQKIDPVKLYQARQRVIREIAYGLADELWAVYEMIEETLDEQASHGVARGWRSLKNLCLSYLSKAEPETVIAPACGAVTASRNMTDKIDGLTILAASNVPERDVALKWFEKAYKSKPAIMDEWLSVQAVARREGVLKDVTRLLKHKAYDSKNPNRVRALLGAFAGNPLGFHAVDGSGYRFIVDQILKLDPINPSVAAGLTKPFLRWKDYEPKRRKHMKEAMEKLAKAKKLSKNVREVVTKALAAK